MVPVSSEIVWPASPQEVLAPIALCKSIPFQYSVSDILYAEHFICVLGVDLCTQKIHVES